MPDWCLSSALAFPSDLGARRPCRGLRGWGCAHCQSLPWGELFPRERKRPRLHSQAGASGVERLFVDMVCLFSVSFSITPSSWALEANFKSLPRVQPWPREFLCPGSAWSASAPLPGSSPKTLPSLSWAANFSAFKAAL